MFSARRGHACIILRRLNAHSVHDERENARVKQLADTCEHVPLPISSHLISSYLSLSVPLSPHSLTLLPSHSPHPKALSSRCFSFFFFFLSTVRFTNWSPAGDTVQTAHENMVYKHMTAEKRTSVKLADATNRRQPRTNDR